MPKIYRIMKKDSQQGGPMTGDTSATLGVRVSTDIRPDAQGNVQPNTGGMSVSPSFDVLIKRLPARMVPERFRNIVPGAVGRNNTFVWSMGDGPFQAASVSAGLCLTIDPTDSGHGFVEPDAIMPLNDYVNYLHSTKGNWTVDEAESA